MGFVDEFKKATEGAPSREAMEAQEQAVLDLLLGKLRGEAAAAAAEALRGQRDEARRLYAGTVRALVAIRAALGCEPGGEVEAVRLVVDEHQRTIEAFAVVTDVLDRVTVELGCVAGDDLAEVVRELKDEGASARALLDAALRAHAPTPGDVLTPDDFGRDEAGVLRLAALLAEAPEGAVVDVPEGAVRPRLFYRASGGGDGWAVYADAGCRFHAVGYVSGPVFHAVWLAKRAPLTVVAWPS